MLAKSAASDNHQSARPPRLILIDAPFSSRLSRYTYSSARKVLPSPLWKPQPPWLIFAWWLGPPLAVLLAVLWLWKMLAPLMR
jgi:hypothetical protein